MPAFQLIVLDKTHHSYGVKCARCGKTLKPGQTAWKHTGRYETRYYCPKCYRQLWH